MLALCRSARALEDELADTCARMQRAAAAGRRRQGACPGATCCRRSRPVSAWQPQSASSWGASWAGSWCGTTPAPVPVADAYVVAAEVRTWLVATDDRVLIVEPESRAFTVEPEDRTHDIAHEDRQIVIEPEDRTHTIH